MKSPNSSEFSAGGLPNWMIELLSGILKDVFKNQSNAKNTDELEREKGIRLDTLNTAFQEAVSQGLSLDAAGMLILHEEFQRQLPRIIGVLENSSYGGALILNMASIITSETNSSNFNEILSNLEALEEIEALEGNLISDVALVISRIVKKFIHRKFDIEIFPGFLDALSELDEKTLTKLQKEFSVNPNKAIEILAFFAAECKPEMLKLAAENIEMEFITSSDALALLRKAHSDKQVNQQPPRASEPTDISSNDVIRLINDMIGGKKFQYTLAELPDIQEFIQSLQGNDLKKLQTWLCTNPDKVLGMLAALCSDKNPDRTFRKFIDHKINELDDILPPPDISEGILNQRIQGYNAMQASRINPRSSGNKTPGQGTVAANNSPDNDKKPAPELQEPPARKIILTSEGETTPVTASQPKSNRANPLTSDSTRQQVQPGSSNPQDGNSGNTFTTREGEKTKDPNARRYL